MSQRSSRDISRVLFGAYGSGSVENFSLHRPQVVGHSGAFSAAFPDRDETAEIIIIRHFSRFETAAAHPFPKCHSQSPQNKAVAENTKLVLSLHRKDHHESVGAYLHFAGWGNLSMPRATLSL